MKNLLSIFTLFLLLRAVSVTAMPIDPGNTVVVDGVQWAQVDLFSELSWNDIQSVCPGGVCGAGTLNGYAMSGWQLASVEEVNGLFNFYLSAAGVPDADLLGPGPDQFWGAEGAWAEQILIDFRPTWESCDPAPAGCTIFELNGWTSGSTQISQLALGYVGTVRNRADPFGSDGMLTDSTFLRNARNASVGGYFFRPAVVPLPSSLALLCMGLLLVRANRR